MNNINSAFERHARAFWTVEDNVLDSMQDVVAGWFERRHTGTQAALEAAQRMCRAATPAELLREYQAWAMGAFERVMADAVAAHGCGVAMSQLMARPLVQLAEASGDAAIGETPASIVVPTVAAPATAETIKPPPLRKAPGVRASA